MKKRTQLVLALLGLTVVAGGAVAAQFATGDYTPAEPGKFIRRFHITRPPTAFTPQARIRFIPQG